MRLIPTGQDALIEMAQLIKSAKHQIDLTYYIFDPCASSTKVLLQLIKQRASAGVHVRMVIDAYTHDFDLRRRYTHLLAQQGIELRYYNARVSMNPAINFRTHAKIMLVDGKEYISGGRNIAQDYFSISPDLNFLDTDVHVRGASAKIAQEFFNKLWNSPRTKAEGPVPDWIAQKISSCVKWGKNEKSLLATIENRATTNIAARPTLSCSRVDFYIDEYNFNQAGLSEQDEDYMSEMRLRRKHTTRELTKLIANTKSILTLQNWSYDPTAAMRKAINGLRKKAIPVYVITNKVTDVGGAMDYINHTSVNKDNWGTEAIMELSSQGAFNDRWDRSPKSAHWMIHSKVYISDDRHTAVTSYNMDARSFHTNLESAVIVRNCPAFADEALKAYAKLSAAWEKDESCSKCQEEPSFGFKDKLKAILARSFY